MEEENKELKVSRFEVEQQLNQFIGNLKVEGMSAEGKIALVELKIELSKIVKELEEYRKTVQESIQKPSNYEELEKKSASKEATDEDKKAFKAVEEEYNKKFVDIALPHFNEIITIPFDFISKDDFKELVKHNDMNVVFGYEYIYNKLVK